MTTRVGEEKYKVAKAGKAGKETLSRFLYILLWVCLFGLGFTFFVLFWGFVCVCICLYALLFALLHPPKQKLCLRPAAPSINRPIVQLIRNVFVLLVFLTHSTALNIAC
jgi:hypothetical protein